jgi:ribosomal protein L29
MNAQETNEIRELTQAELDEVTGAATEQFRGRYQLKLSEASGLLQSTPQK